MVQCKKCKLFVSVAKDDVVKCKGQCEAVYHKKMRQKSKSVFEERNMWRLYTKGRILFTQ